MGKIEIAASPSPSTIANPDHRNRVSITAFEGRSMMSPPAMSAPERYSV